MSNTAIYYLFIDLFINSLIDSYANFTLVVLFFLTYFILIMICRILNLTSLLFLSEGLAENHHFVLKCFWTIVSEDLAIVFCGMFLSYLKTRNCEWQLRVRCQGSVSRKHRKQSTSFPGLLPSVEIGRGEASLVYNCRLN